MQQQNGPSGADVEPKHTEEERKKERNIIHLNLLQNFFKKILHFIGLV